MRLLDVSYDDPAMNLALDEALLDSVEIGEGAEAGVSPLPRSLDLNGQRARLARHRQQEQEQCARLLSFLVYLVDCLCLFWILVSTAER